MLTASSSSSRTILTLSGETLPVGMLHQYCPHASPVPAKPCLRPEPLPAFACCHAIPLPTTLSFAGPPVVTALASPVPL